MTRARNNAVTQKNLSAGLHLIRSFDHRIRIHL